MTINGTNSAENSATSNGGRFNFMETNKIICGDSLAVLKTLPAESVDCIVTSPPYHGLRDYGVGGQIGLEKTLNEYLGKMLAITAELKRVLKKSGTMWWDHGDSYGHKQNMGQQGKHGGRKDRKFTPSSIGANDGLEKSLMLQAHRLAIRMIDEQQWILRNTIIWHKPNCMPSSIKDRFTVDYEPVFFFTKSRRYYFERQLEPLKPGTLERSQYTFGGVPGRAYPGEKREHPYPEKWNFDPAGRNKRCVWKVPTHSFGEAHFATFPEKLIEPMISAGCPREVCTKCKKPRYPIFEPSEEYAKLLKKSWTEDTDKDNGLRQSIGFAANRICGQHEKSILPRGL